MNYTNNNSNRPIAIGLDHGFGNMKTAHCCFQSGVTVHEKEPTFKRNLLIYEGRYYTIGDEHKSFMPDKASDEDYYILTLAGIACELKSRGLTSALTANSWNYYNEPLKCTRSKCSYDKC